jgi:hypothetical protein
MIPFTGRSKETTLVKKKPTPVGFKVWVIAQHGFFLRWLWHVKRSPYKAVIVKLPSLKPQGKKGKIKTEVTLSNTQSVVFHLCNMRQKRHITSSQITSSPHQISSVPFARQATGPQAQHAQIAASVRS